MLIIVWTSSCPVATAKRPAFLVSVFDALEAQIPNPQALTSRDDHGMTISNFSYMAGTTQGNVTLSTDTAGGDIVIAVLLQEPIGR